MSTPSRQDFMILIIRSASTGLSRLFTKIPKIYRIAMLPRQLLLRPTVLRPQTLLSMTKPSKILPFAAGTLTNSPYSKTLREATTEALLRLPASPLLQSAHGLGILARRPATQAPPRILLIATLPWRGNTPSRCSPREEATARPQRPGI